MNTTVLAQTASDAATIQQGIYEIRPLTDTTKTLDVGVSQGNGDNVKQWESSGNPNQQWRITEADGGYYRISPLHDTTLCLDAAGVTRGATIRVWAYEGEPNQQWQFYADSVFYEVAPRSIVEGEEVPTLRMDVVGGQTTNNANVRLYTDNNSLAQRWYLKWIRDAVASNDGSGDDGDNGGDTEDDGEEGGEDGGVGSNPDPVLAIDDPVDSKVLAFLVFPNPTQSEVVWKRSVGEPATLSVVTLRGQVVIRESVIGTQGTLSIQGLSCGIYFITIQTANQQHRQRLIVK